MRLSKAISTSKLTDRRKNYNSHIGNNFIQKICKTSLCIKYHGRQTVFLKQKFFFTQSPLLLSKLEVQLIQRQIFHIHKRLFYLVFMMVTGKISQAEKVDLTFKRGRVENH